MPRDAAGSCGWGNRWALSGAGLDPQFDLDLIGTAERALKKNLWTLNFFCISGKDWAISGFSSSQFPKSWCHLLSKSVPREWLWHNSDAQMFSMCAELLHSSAKPFTLDPGEPSGEYRRLYKGMPFCVKIQVHDRRKRPPLVLTDNLNLTDPLEIENEVKKRKV